MTWNERYEAYKTVWKDKGVTKAKKELASYQKYLSRHKDRFHQQSAPGELSDGDRVLALKEVLSELECA